MEVDPDLLHAIGQKVRSLREAKGLSQYALCAEANVARSQLTRLEKGQLNITIGTLHALAKALDVPVTTLVEYR